MKNSSHDSQQLQKQIHLYDKLIGSQNVEAEEIQQSILDFATGYESIKIDKLSETHISESNGFEVITNQLTLEGNFQSLIEVIYEFEKKFKVSSIVSINFIKEKKYDQRKSRLKVQLIFQNYEKVS
ncbi:hypothetical protein [uncultured Maribacter sp.]|uniref:hypothetical protein n=1 Tax=uncultured Maribacter sp. TaxID=431308 RepID=UPI002607CD5B|nr:hypothetical protein [uncultured Maribacter sp.]